MLGTLYKLDDFELYQKAREFRKYDLIKRINGYIAYLNKCKQE